MGYFLNMVFTNIILVVLFAPCVYSKLEFRFLCLNLVIPRGVAFGADFHRLFIYCHAVGAGGTDTLDSISFVFSSLSSCLSSILLSSFPLS